ALGKPWQIQDRSLRPGQLQPPTLSTWWAEITLGHHRIPCQALLLASLIVGQRGPGQPTTRPSDAPATECGAYSVEATESMPKSQRCEADAECFQNFRAK
ncbi:Hypothetical predicted protein, partial [Pelobates cultripes]